MAQNNSTILTAAFVSASNDFQQRVPAPDKAGIAATAKFLLDPFNNKYFNEFTDLMYQIGLTIVEQKAFENPLAEFKKEPLYYGNTVREIASDWIKAHAFDPSDESLLKASNPEFDEWFYSITREDRYDFTINMVELRKALAGVAGGDGEGYQLNSIISAKTQSAINSDNYDEMNIMLNLAAFADKNWGAGLFKKQIAEPVNQATSQAFLATVKSDVARLKFPSKLYNSINVPVFAQKNELVLLITPEAAAKTDVYSWFNRLVGLEMDKQASIVVEVPELPINGAFAMLTTRDWFQCRDSFYMIDTFRDPKTQNMHYFLHHQGSYAASPYVPCIVYTTEAGTATSTVTVSVTGLSLAPTAVSDDAEVILDKSVSGTVTTVTVDSAYLDTDVYAIKMNAAYSGTVTPGDTPVTIPTAGVTYQLLGIAKGSTTIPANKRTYISEDGTLHLQSLASYIDSETAVTVRFGYAGSYINPSGGTASLAGEVVFSIKAGE